MILTYKVKHELDFSKQLQQAKMVAKFAVANRDKLSSKYVAWAGLPSAISNQILREYGRNNNCQKPKTTTMATASSSGKM